MGRTCFVCGSKVKEDSVNLFQFPSEERMKNRWQYNINKFANADRKEPTKCACVCSRHFRKHYIIDTNSKSPKLVKDAVPTIFENSELNYADYNDASIEEYPPDPIDPLDLVDDSPPTPAQIRIKAERGIEMDCNVLLEELTDDSMFNFAQPFYSSIKSESDSITPKRKTERMIYAGDVDETTLPTPEKALKSIRLLKKIIEDKNRQLGNLNRQMSRMRAKMTNMQRKIRELEDEKCKNASVVDNSDYRVKQEQY